MRLLVLFGLIITTITSCEKLDIAEGTPTCIVNKIKDFNKHSACDNPKVEQYSFQQKYVYVFHPGTCGGDLTTEVSDSDCNVIGTLGGLSGNTKINGEEFSNATFIKLIWRK